MRYHVLKAGVTIRNAVVCLALVAGSYLASGLVNASPVTQPAIAAPRVRGVLLAPPPAEAGRESPMEAPANPLPDRSDSIRSL